MCEKQEIDIIDLKEQEGSEINSEEDETEEQENIEDIEIEARFVANKIKELVESKYQVFDLKKQQYRDLKYKDIVVLLRTTKCKAPIFEKELIENDIPVYSDMSAEYIDTMEIQTIISLLKIIDNPMQDIPLVTVMRSSIGKFTDNDLVEIRLVDQQSDFYTALQKAKLSVDTELKEKIDGFLNKLDEWREEQEYLSLDELIWKIYEDTGFLNYVGILPNGALRQANLKMLFERAKQYESASFKGLFNFIRFIERLRLSSGDLSSAKMIGENEDVVRIMSIHKSKGLEFPIVFLASASSNFNLMDLNKEILLDQELGLGVKYIDYEAQIKYDTLTKLALRNKEMNAIYSEEMRILYVALTRAKEKLFITGLSKDFNKEKENMEKFISIYKKQNGKINPILIKKYKSYLNWILMVYYSDFDKMKNVAYINIYNKEDFIKGLKKDEEEELDICKLLEEKSKNISEQELEKLDKQLNFEYKHKEATIIPSKTSITAIAHNDMEKMKTTVINEDDYLKSLNNEDTQYDLLNINEEDKSNEFDKIKFSIPKILQNEAEEKVSATRRGTIVHLCMKNLDFSRDYELEDIKDLIKDLENKRIITTKEAESVNPNQILKFTQSDLWQELKNAKEFHKEEPFYINVPVCKLGIKDEILKKAECDENILAQGIIDLYYIDKDDKLVLLDYKTDFVKSGEEDILIKRHTPQLLLYKQALEDGLKRKVDRIYIYSTCLGKNIVTKFYN